MDKILRNMKEKTIASAIKANFISFRLLFSRLPTIKIFKGGIVTTVLTFPTEIAFILDILSVFKMLFFLMGQIFSLESICDMSYFQNFRLLPQGHVNHRSKDTDCSNNAWPFPGFLPCPRRESRALKLARICKTLAWPVLILFIMSIISNYASAEEQFRQFQKI